MMDISRKFYKKLSTYNPLLSNIFCADPTAVEYNGRLYVYGTNDQEQYEFAGVNGKNTYEHIKSLVCFSTQDMTNWTYHGAIDVGKIAPWIYSAWAPSVVSRKEADGFTHFYLYFSNSGNGVGVLTATNPEGPWSSPLNGPLIHNKLKGLEKVPNPFDPGACIDGEGRGWLTFGGGTAPDGNDAMPGTVRIVRLGKDMISLDSDFVEIKAPYFFEASELNFINGTYIYSFNNRWVERKEWNYEAEKSTACSMSYMTTKTPLVSDSWKYEGHYFKNPGEQGLNYSNNHTHFIKYKGQWYLFYHTLTLQEETPANGGFRSICADKLKVDEENVKIYLSTGTRSGVSKTENLNPFTENSGSTMCTSAEIDFCKITESGKNEILIHSKTDGSWTMVKNADFSLTADKWGESISFRAKGKGFLEVRLDKAGADRICRVEIDSREVADYSVNFNTKITGLHDIFFVFTKDLYMQSWLVK